MRVSNMVNAQVPEVEMSDGRTLNLKTAMATLAKAGRKDRLNLADVKVSRLALGFAQKVGYGDIVNIRSNQKIEFYLIEFLATTDEITLPGERNVAIAMGVGVRVALGTTELSGNTTGNLAGLSAAATLTSINQNIKADVLGCPNNLKKGFLDAFGTPAKFDIETLRTFGKAVSNLADGIVKGWRADPGAFDPQPIRVIEYLPNAYALRDIAASNGYALHRITERDSFPQALEHLEAKARSTNYPYELVDPVAVELVYRSIVESTSNPPSDAHRQLAETIQRLGR